MVELAVILPVVLVVIFGTLDITQRLLLRQTAVVVAHETARLAARHGIDAQTARHRGDQMLLERGLDGTRITLTPPDPLQLTRGERLRVDVEIPLDNNMIAFLSSLAGGTINAGTTYVHH